MIKKYDKKIFFVKLVNLMLCLCSISQFYFINLMSI